MIPWIPLIVLIASIVVCVVCTALVLHPEYEDGLWGRLALSVFSISAVGRMPEVFDAAFDDGYLRISAQGIAVWIALAVFFGRHWWRFYLARKGRYFAGMRERRGLQPKEFVK